MSVASPIGLVLAGGGARGAYEVGILAGISEVLNMLPKDRPRFNVLAGTSVGAINAAFLAANAHRGDYAIADLVSVWKNLDVGSHLRLNLRGRAKKAGLSIPPGPGLFGKSFIDPRPLENLVRASIDWDRVHSNISRGAVSALAVAAFNLGSGRTGIFVETAPGVTFRPSADPRRRARLEPITAEHVLGSAAIPVLFPARKINGAYYCDGGVRFNTPISPAIRSGAKRLVVISLQSDLRHPGAEPPPLRSYPSAALVFGKLLNALLLDPFQYDLAVMRRFNQLVSVLEETLSAAEFQRVQDVIVETRGARYRKLGTLVFTPSQDVGLLAGEHLRSQGGGWPGMDTLPKFLLNRAAQSDATWEADWASYMLFDGTFASRLVELGLRDALARADDIHTFFSSEDPVQL